MTNSHNIRTIFLTFLLSLSFSIHAQVNDQGTKKLVVILQEIQAKFNVQFNYAEDQVTNVSVTNPPAYTSLSEILSYLEKNTALTFTRVDEKFILIKLRDELLLCGYLKDKDNLKPIVAATVQGDKSATITDENGFFQLRIRNIKEQISIRHIGYKTILRSYERFFTSDCGFIYMRSQAESLSQITISNYITSGIHKMNDGSYKINFQSFDMLPGMIENDVLQAVQAFPGIQSTNETVSNINIRGGTHDQNLLLWDGIKMYQSGHFFGLISMYNPQITQQVSLLKNGSDPSYTDGVSGTINMQTDKSLNSTLKASIGANFTDVNAFVDAPLGEKSSIQVAARKSLNDFIETPTYKAYFERIEENTEVQENQPNIINSDKMFDFYDASFRWLYKINDTNEIRLNAILVSNQLNFNETATINLTEESRESILTQNSFAAGLFYKNIWRDKFITTLEIYETDYRLKAINVNILDSQRFLQENSVSETSAKLQVEYLLNDKLTVLGGYHFVETEVTNLDDVDEPIFRFLVSEVVRTHGLFSQVSYTSQDQNTHLKVGVRHNYIDKFKKHLTEPRFSFSQTIADKFTVEVLGELKHQNTSQIINFQNDFLGIEKRRWQLSNDEDIPVIKSQQVSTGISYNDQGWLASVEAYYKKVTGITSQSQGFQNQFEFTKSQGNYQVLGLDVLLRKKIANINTWISYSFMKNDYEFKELESARFPSNYDITHAFTSGVTYTQKNLKVGLGFNWRFGKPITEPVFGNELINQEINFNTTNSSRLNDYMRLDLSAAYQIKISSQLKADVAFAVWNILDRENQIEQFFDVTDDRIDETTQFSLGMTPNVSFRVFF